MHPLFSLWAEGRSESVCQHVQPSIVDITSVFFSEFATDIATIYPEKNVTLLHSRKRLLPRFDEAMHDESENAFECMLSFADFSSLVLPPALKVLETMENIDVILGERLDMSSFREQHDDVSFECILRKSLCIYFYSEIFLVFLRKSSCISRKKNPKKYQDTVRRNEIIVLKETYKET